MMERRKYRQNRKSGENHGKYSKGGKNKDNENAKALLFPVSFLFSSIHPLLQKRKYKKEAVLILLITRCFSNGIVSKYQYYLIIASSDINTRGIDAARALRKKVLKMDRPYGHACGVRLTGLRPEGCGRLTAAGCVEGLRKKVLRIDGLSGPRVLKFDGFGPRVVVSPLRCIANTF